METINILGSYLGIAFVCGINLYATILTIGLGTRLGLIQLFPGISGLESLANPWIILIAGILYVGEFFADKIPWFDSVWDSFHTFIRPIGAAFIATTAIGHVDPIVELTMILLCFGTAVSSHSSKASTRLKINESPEPFSNSIVSILEDIFAVVGCYLSIKHPIVVLIILIVFLAIFIWVYPKLWRMQRVMAMSVYQLLKKYFSSEKNDYVISEKYQEFIEEKESIEDIAIRAKCVAGKGVPKLRNSIGFILLTDNKCYFITRKWFRFRKIEFEFNNFKSIKMLKGLLLDRIVMKSDKRRMTFMFFKHALNHAQLVSLFLEEQMNLSRTS